MSTKPKDCKKLWEFGDDEPSSTPPPVRMLTTVVIPDLHIDYPDLSDVEHFTVVA